MARILISHHFFCRHGAPSLVACHGTKAAPPLRLRKEHLCQFLCAAKDNSDPGGQPSFRSAAEVSLHWKEGFCFNAENWLINEKCFRRYVANVLELSRKGCPNDGLEISSFLKECRPALVIKLFLCLLQDCTKRRDLEAGRKVHALLTNSGLASNTLLGNHLIRLFSTCGSVSEANQMFCSLSKPDIHSWVAIIAAHAQYGDSKKVMRLYDKMQQLSITPNEYAYVEVLKACAGGHDFRSGKRIHADTINKGYDRNLYVGAALIGMYTKCGKADEALNVFTKLPKSDIVCWNAIITGLTQNERGDEALQLFIDMKSEGLKPNHLTYVSVLKACTAVGDLVQGRLIHSQIINCGLLHNVTIGSTLVDMYAKCGAVQEALKIFEKLPMKNVVTWNATIAGFAEHGLGKEALQLFRRMQKEGIKPDSFTFVSALKACGRIGALDEGKQIHHQVVAFGFEEDAFIGSALIDMYIKCKNLQEAEQVLKKYKKLPLPFWNSMISGCIQYGQFEQAFQLFERMEDEGVVPDKITFLCMLKACSSILALDKGKLIHTQTIHNGLDSDCCVGSALVDMYTKCGRLNEAFEAFGKIRCRDVVVWNALIVGVVQHGLNEKALELYDAMGLEGVEPDEVTMIMILKACGRLASTDYGKIIHDRIVEHRLESDEIVGSNLVDMYVKCGSLEMACQVFDKLQRKNVLAWNAMIKGHGMHGHEQMSIDFFDKMQQEGTKCDGVTFVSILGICGSLGATEKGMQIHQQIVNEGFESDLFVGNSLINMYVKCGTLNNACKVFEGMMVKDSVSWNTIIAGYAQHQLYQDALDLFERMQQEGIEPNDMTLVSVLRCCGSIFAADTGKRIHEHIVGKQPGFDFFVGNALMDMYAKCGSLTKACEVFDSLPERNLQSWNALLSGYAHHGLGQLAVQHFQRMQHEGLKPDDISLVSIISACSHSNLVDVGFHVFQSVLERGIEPVNNQHYACVADLLSRAGSLHDAEDFIRKLQLQIDAVS